MHANAVPVLDKSMVLGKATVRAAHDLALSNAALARVIGLSEPTISRISDGQLGIDPDSKAGQLSLLLVRLFQSLDSLVGPDPQQRRDWLCSHNKVLNDKPATLIELPQGLVMVLGLLDGALAAGQPPPSLTPPPPQTPPHCAPPC